MPESSPEEDSAAPPKVQYRAVVGAGYTAFSSIITLVVGFTRSIFLARLLLPEDFGVITFALFFTSLIGSLTNFGFRQAFIHSDPEDEQRAANAMFLVDITIAVAQLFLVFLLQPVFTRLYPQYQLLPKILLIFFAAYIIGAATGTPLAILERHLAYRRIALLNIIISITITIATVVMAFAGMGVWALVAEVILSRVVMFVGLFFIRPPWRFQGQVEWNFIRRFTRFGLSISITHILGFLIDQFDDFWTGASLGKAPLGYYSKAYEYARYPRRVLSDPIVSVVFPTFSRLKHDRQELSQAFARSFGVLIRLGFLVSITMYLTAAELVQVAIGPKWLPMVNTYRLMIVYTLIDPLISIAAMLFIAVGKPGVTTTIRLLQMLVFVPGVILLGNRFGIDGVAIAADIMVVLGFIFVIIQSTRYVDFSMKQLFLAPVVAFLVAGLSVSGIAATVLTHSSPLWSLIIKGGVSALVYGLISFGLERPLYQKYYAFLKPMLDARLARLSARHRKG